MKSIFTRTYIVVAILVFFTFIATLIIVDNIFETTDTEIFKKEALIEARYIESQLQHIPQAQWQQWVERYQPTLFLDIGLGNNYEHSLTQKTRFSGARSDPWMLIYSIASSPHVLLLAEPDDRFSDIPADDWYEILIPLATIFSILALGIVFLSRKISKPVSVLSQAVNHAGDGNLEVRVSEKMPYPVSNLARGFNQMAERLQRLIAEQQILIGAIPHELRSPIGRIRFALDTTRNAKSIDEIRDQIERVDHYVDDLEDVTEQTLMLARLQNKDAMEYEFFDANELVNRVCSQFSEDGQKQISWLKGTAMMLKGNQALIYRALSNLLENAIQYADKKIIVDLQQLGDGRICLSVEDDGPGIPEKERKTVFSPYYRLDESRNRRTGGVGLGLALVDMIVKKHGGEVRALKGTLNGARIEMIWDAN